jgi:hypothetical protein
MTLYDIDQRIADLIDPATGEITDYAALDELAMAREDKIGRSYTPAATPLQI